LGTAAQPFASLAFRASVSSGWSGCSHPIMRLFINSLAASAGGGLTYIRNTIPHLAIIPDLHVAVLAAPGIGKEFPTFSNVELMELEISTGRRFLYEQTRLRELLHSWHAEILLSTGNFALRNSPVPQILLSRNSIYTSADFYRDLLSRHEYRMWLDTRIRGAFARKSIAWADLTVAPSKAFAAELRRWSGVNNVVAIHHGFDVDSFTRNHRPLQPEVENRLRAAENSLKLLFVSHYNYYRNFEMLIRALPEIRQRLSRQAVKLLLTCKLTPGENPGAYRPNRAASLIKELGLQDTVVELGSVPYPQLHHLYRRADLYVTPAYTETFAHPLVEAMSCGLPIVASDLQVHREICGEAALYFSRYSAVELADRVVEVISADDVRRTVKEKAMERCRAFSWSRHIQQLLELARALSSNRKAISMAL
jgi:glycosyltransferase involved in cell wall biosynthesis